MEILWWLAPPVVVTIVAMTWVSVLGRSRPENERSEAAQERARQRFAEAIAKDAPASIRTRPRPAPRSGDRSTGVAVRPSRRSA